VNAVHVLPSTYFPTTHSR